MAVKDFPREPAEGGVLCGKESAHGVGLRYVNRTRPISPFGVHVAGFGSKRQLHAPVSANIVFLPAGNRRCDVSGVHLAAGIHPAAGRGWKFDRASLFSRDAPVGYSALRRRARVRRRGG
jgi:hypothetical protein